MMASDLADAARVAYTAGDYARSRDLALQALSATPDNVELLRTLGQSSVELDESDAPAYFQRIVELEPGSADGWRELADAHMVQGEVRKAVRAYQEALRLRPD